MQGVIARFRIGRVVVLVAAALTGSCYESEFPLDPAPLSGLDDALLGTWRCLPLDAEAEEQPATLTVTRARDRVYGAAWQETGKDPEHYEAFASSLRGTRLLNIQEVKVTGARGKWVFGRYTLLRPNVLQIQIVADKALEGVQKSRAAVRQAIERLRGSPALYVDFCVCARAKETK